MIGPARVFAFSLAGSTKAYKARFCPLGFLVPDTLIPSVVAALKQGTFE
jgi:hypothetical protein